MSYGLEKKNKAVGIDIDGSSIRIVELSRYDGGINLSKCTAVETGQVTPDEAARKVKEVLAESNLSLSKSKGSISNVMVTSNIKVILRVARLNSIDPVEISKMVIFEAEKLVPLDVTELWVDHQVIKKEGNSSEVLISAVKRKEIADIFSFCTLADIEPEAVGIAGLASLSWLLYNHGDFSGCIAAANIRSQNINITFCEDLTPLSIESFILSKDENKSFDQSKGLLIAVEKSLNLLSFGLKGNINKLFIAGKGAKGLCQIPEIKHLSPEHLDVGKKIRIAPDIEKQFQLDEFIPALGLALWGLGEARYTLDLYPDDRRQLELIEKRKKYGIIGAIILGLTTVIIVTFLSFQIAAQKSKLAVLSHQVSNREKMAEEAKLIINSRSDSYDLVYLIMEILPLGTSLSEIRFEQGKSIEISGITADHVALHDFKEKIETSKYARNYGFRNAKVSQAIGRSEGRIQFEIRCDHFIDVEIMKHSEKD